MEDWSNMPQDLLDLILSNLFAKDQSVFSLVCRSWHQAVLASPYRGRCHSPYLVYHQKSNDLWRFSQHDTFFTKRFPEFDNAVIRFSNHGWFLMMPRDDNTIFFFDPFNNQTIQLPSPPIHFSYTTICFFHPPTSPECFVVGIERFIEYPDYFVYIGVLRKGEGWKNYSYPTKRGLDLSLSPPVLKNGLVYFMDVEGNVATFDISKHGFTNAWSVYSECIREHWLREYNEITEHFLIKLEGEDSIFAVFGIDEERYVKVYRLLEPAISWEPVHDLGEKVFFVSNTSSRACDESMANKIFLAKDSRMANKIFLPRLHGDKFVYYSLDTRKYHSFDGNYSSRNSYGLKRLDFATWTTPTQQFDSVDELSWCVQAVDEEDAAT